MKNQVQLITYVDRLGGGNLATLHMLLQGPLEGLFGAVHLLPFFTPYDGADAGFDPRDHREVDPRLGTWRDVQTLANDHELLADLIVNHISRDSPQCQDWLDRGADSLWDGLVLTQQRIFPEGATSEQLKAIYRPRPGLPFSTVTLGDGSTVHLWTTFTPDQVDIDVSHPLGIAYLDDILRTFAAHGVRMVRLDAVGYTIKKAGTSCFMLPETFDFIAALSARVRALGMEVLVEIHSYYRQQQAIAQRVDWVYDFALPPLLLHAFTFRTAGPLRKWLRERPHNAVTVLDTHDGIGIIDIGAGPAGEPGLVPPHELDALVEAIHVNSGNNSRLATGAAASNLDLYQVNCTYFDALGRKALHYLLARAVQFFVPGLPQVYYVGLLAGGNDMDLLQRSGVGRDINRHYYSTDEIEEALQTPVVHCLCALIRLRNTHPAFQGQFTLHESNDETLDLQWHHGSDQARLQVNFADFSHALQVSSGTRLVDIDLLTLGQDSDLGAGEAPASSKQHGN